MVQHFPQAMSICLNERLLSAWLSMYIFEVQLEGIPFQGTRSVFRLLKCNKTLFAGSDGLAYQVGKIDSGRFNRDGVCIQLRYLQEAINHHGQAITCLIDGEQKFVPFFARDTVFMAQKSGSIAFD